MSSEPVQDVNPEQQSQSVDKSEGNKVDESDMILFNALNEELGRYNSELAAKEKSEKAFGARIDKQSI